jgi:hypothetical protein
MGRRRRIVLYGNSVILAGIGASLERTERFELLHLSPPLPDGTELGAMDPDVVLFDVESTLPAPPFSVLEAHPGLLLFGVSPDGNLVSLWSGRQYRELTTKDLTTLIEAESEAGPDPAHGRSGGEGGGTYV